MLSWAVAWTEASSRSPIARRRAGRGSRRQPAPRPGTASGVGRNRRRWRRGCRGRRHAAGWRSDRAARSPRNRPGCTLDVGLDDPSAGAAADDGRDVDTELPGEPSRGRGCRSTAGGGHRRQFDDGKERALGHDVALGGPHLGDPPVDRGGHFGRHLLNLHLGDRIARPDRLSRLDEPRDEDALLGGLGQAGHADLVAHRELRCVGGGAGPGRRRAAGWSPRRRLVVEPSPRGGTAAPAADADCIEAGSRPEPPAPTPRFERISSRAASSRRPRSSGDRAGRTPRAAASRGSGRRGRRVAWGARRGGRRRLRRRS